VDAIQVDGSAMDRQLVTRVEPIYPSQAKSQHIQGDVRLQVRVSQDGTVQDVNLVSGPPQLVGAAIAAVKQWKYQPTMSSGHPVAVLTIVSVSFRLPSPDK
jgi:TonB family protein